MIISVRTIGNYKVVDVGEPMRAYEDVTAIRNKLDELMDAGELYVAINMGKIDFMHSFFIKIMTVTYKKLKLKGGDLCIIGANEFIRNLMRLLNIDEYIAVFASEEGFRNYLEKPAV